ncbi:hypothetical protein BJX99DRAFT_226279 [Aspergillus californicus]
MLGSGFLSRFFQRTPRLQGQEAQKQRRAIRQLSWSRATLQSPGIQDITCATNSYPSNADRLPVHPPDHECLYATLRDSDGRRSGCGSDMNTEQQSPFFCMLPPEISRNRFIFSRFR